MEQVEFLIDKISYGWFDVSFKGSDWKVAISASDAWGTDTPALLFKEIVKQKNENLPASLYVVFDEEPGTYLLTLERKAEQSAILTVCYSEYDDDEWPEIERAGRKTLVELSNLLPINETVLRAEIDYHFFLHSVYKAFLPYENTLTKIQYEKNWMLFPIKQWTEFKDFLDNFSVNKQGG